MDWIEDKKATGTKMGMKFYFLQFIVSKIGNFHTNLLLVSMKLLFAAVYD